MMHKFASGLKTKTVELFAEEDGVDGEDEEDGTFKATDPQLAEEMITNQRVVVIKPDGPNKHSGHHDVRESLVFSVFSAISSFHESYLHLQIAHEPFDPTAIEVADRAVVSQLQRLLDIRRAYFDLPRSSKSPLSLPSTLEAQVQENQCMLRMLKAVSNRLEADIDRREAEVSSLKQELTEIEASYSLLERNLNNLCSSALIEAQRAFFSISVFDSVLKGGCLAAHRFTKALAGMMENRRWDLVSVANSIHPNVGYAKKGHCRYAFLSFVCLGMFGGFGTSEFCRSLPGVGSDGEQSNSSRRDRRLREFIEHLAAADAARLLDANPRGDFARFCENKYRMVVKPAMESTLSEKMEWRSPALRSCPLYRLFIAMCSSVWMVHVLAMAFDRPVQIFQVRQGSEFSVVFMEDVLLEHGYLKDTRSPMARRKIGFTVFPGFRIGNLVIQCRVYLNLN